MRKCLFLTLVFLFCGNSMAQEPNDPAFDPPYRSPAQGVGSGIRWNGAVGIVVINGRVYQQFGIRPDIPFGKWGVGLDLTVRFDEDGNFKDDEWDEGLDYITKIYYIRYAQPGDPFYLRIGALDNVTLGYGFVMKRYANTIQYPEVKRIGVYTEGGSKGIGWQGIMANLREMDEPGVIGGRVSFDTGIKGITIGGTLVHDGNQFAGLLDTDKDGVPDRLDLFPDENDFLRRDELSALLTQDQIDQLIAWGDLPDIRRTATDYKDIKESVTISGADVGMPLWKRKNVSLWTYAQAAQIVDFGWGWAFPGARLVAGPLELGAEFRHYNREFMGEFFNYTYDIERVQLAAHDSLFATKESRLAGLGHADGVYTDATLTWLNMGYVYGWYLDMRGDNYPVGRTIYTEAGITPPMLSRLQKVEGYYMQPNVKTLFDKITEGTIYGGKLYFGLAQNVSLVYDHRVTYSNGTRYRTVRVETMVSF